MDALLILGGCFVLVGSFFWLALRAFARGAGWGLLCLLPPLTLLYLFRHRREARETVEDVGVGSGGCHRQQRDVTDRRGEAAQAAERRD